MAEDPKAPVSSVSLALSPDRSDILLGRVLGGNLMDATARVVGLLVVAGVVLATIAWLAG